MTVTILHGDTRDVLATLPSDHFDCVVTSPPYFGLRDYGVDGQIGLEETFPEYLDTMVDVFRAVRRVLKPTGVCWLNIGDSYAGSRARTPGLKPKDLCMAPARLAIMLQEDGWWLRDRIIWAKPNGMPGSQQDRCTSSYEEIFMLTKSADYECDFDAIKTPPRESTLIRTAQDVQAQAGSHRANGGAKTNGAMKACGGVADGDRRDKQRGHSRRHAGFNDRWDAMERREQQAKPAMMRNVWFVAPAGYKDAHFAVMPEEIARRCILAGSLGGGAYSRPVRRRRNDRTGRSAPRPQRDVDRTQPGFHSPRAAPHCGCRALAR